MGGFRASIARCAVSWHQDAARGAANVHPLARCQQLVQLTIPTELSKRFNSATPFLFNRKGIGTTKFRQFVFNSNPASNAIAGCNFRDRIRTF